MFLDCRASNEARNDCHCEKFATKQSMLNHNTQLGWNYFCFNLQNNPIKVRVDGDCTTQ